MFGMKSKEEILGLDLFKNPMLTPGWKEALIKGEALTYSIKYDFSLVEGYYDTEKKGYIDLISKATQLQHDMRIMRGGKHTTWTPRECDGKRFAPGRGYYRHGLRQLRHYQT